MTLSYDDFVEKCKPIQNEFPNPCGGFDNTMFETYGEELGYVKLINEQSPENVFTIVEVEDNLYILKGFHLVNRHGYFITKNPCDVEFSEILID